MRKLLKIMGSSHIHCVEKLSDGDSWSFLCDIALKGREMEYMKFEKVGKEIANKCKGVPLALATLGSLLRVRETLQNWRDISENDIWGLAQVEDIFLPSLFLSYYALPPILKQCFLYCAVFPKDTIMRKNRMVKLWMAEGFLGSGRMRHLEKAGEECFDNLSMRSFFQDFKKDSHGNIISCQMHDLVHDFAHHLSLKACSDNAEFDPNKVRYLYWEGLENSLLCEAKKVRTLIGKEISWVSDDKREISFDLFDRLPRRLRVLDLGYSDLKELPEAIKELVHLRYLDLSCTKVLELPETISNLYNLQTLILNSCWSLQKLPEEIGRLFNLRHLEIEGTEALKYLPQSVKRLSSLRTLSKFIVSEGLKIDDLKHFNYLGGALQLEGLGGIIDERDAIEADLKLKKDIRCLSFYWEESDGVAPVRGMEKMFEGLEPHEDLEELNIIGYPGFQFPRWVHNISVLGNMVEMRLHGCRHITVLPALGKLGSLRKLGIFKMESVESIGPEFYGFDSSLGAEMIAFPKLKKLELDGMDGLENWEVPIFSKDTKIMPLLSELRLQNCPNLKALPPCLGKLESLKLLWIQGLNCIQCLDLGTSQEEQVLFPKLQRLIIDEMDKLEQWSEEYKVNGMMSSLSYLTIERCPSLRVLPDLSKFKSLVDLGLCDLDSWEGQMEEDIVRNEKEIGELHRFIPDYVCIKKCPKLNEVPSYLFSPTLEELTIGDSPDLRGLQCLPPLLEKLVLLDDCGGYSKSIPFAANKECSITRFFLSHHPHSTLPEGFKELKALRELQFQECNHLDFELKELQHFTMLQELAINECPLLEEHFKGDDWRSILAHVPKITINYKEITNRSS